MSRRASRVSLSFGLQRAARLPQLAASSLAGAEVQLAGVLVRTSRDLGRTLEFTEATAHIFQKEVSLRVKLTQWGNSHSSRKAATASKNINRH